MLNRFNCRLDRAKSETAKVEIWQRGRGRGEQEGKGRMWQKRESMQHISKVFLKEVTEHKEGR